MKPLTSIDVKYRHVDGWHVFTSDSIPGLYVANKDPELAFNDVALSIKKLLWLNERVKCEVVAERSFEEFLKSVKSGSLNTPNEKSPAELSNRRYALCLAA